MATRRLKMAGKVFISCGQRPPREKNIAEKVGKLIKDKFGLDYYLAFKIQGLEDIMKITEELRSSDYYLFIDFLRRDKDSLPCSLFTHQELALAHHLKFQEVIAFQEKGTPLEGFLKYIQANPEKFRDEKELLEKVEQIIRARGWNSQYSRNLVVSEANRIGPLSYGDHTGSYFEWVWDIKVENRRLDIAAINTSCLLDYIIFPNGEKKDCPDRSWLKWGGQIGYQRTILPQDYGVVNIFAIHYNENGIYLHSAQDVVPRIAIVTEEGDYKFYYKIFAEHFPLLSFTIQVNYRHTLITAQPNINQTIAHLL